MCKLKFAIIAHRLSLRLNLFQFLIYARIFIYVSSSFVTCDFPVEHIGTLHDIVFDFYGYERNFERT